MTREGEPVAGEQSRLRFRFAQAATGEPVDDLQPYLASAGHVIVMSADGSTFAHTHAEQLDADGRLVFAVPGTTFGSELGLHHHFDEPGLYRLWAQFRTAAGQVVTVPCTVDAA